MRTFFLGRWVAGLLSFFLVIAFLNPARAAVERKVALVIGNAAYTTVSPLPNPINDASAVAEELKAIGFDVMLRDNLDNSGLRHALQDFEDKVAGSQIAIVYYAGHGIEINGINYLIPTDAKLARDSHVVDEAVSLDRVIASMSAASTLSLVLLDACRDNPFAARMLRAGSSRSIGRGLAPLEPVGATLVSFSAEAGTTASDGNGDHSPYTSALLRHLATPGLEVNFIFRRISKDVRDSTAGSQKPVYYGSLGSDEVYLVPAPPPPPPAPPPAAPTPVAVAQPAPETSAPEPVSVEHLPVEELLWRTIRASTVAEDFRSYLRRYPNGAFADLARARVLALGRATEIATMAPGGADGMADSIALRKAAMANIGRVPVNFIQYGLVALDFRVKDVNGILDSVTRSAIREYQASINETQTGQLTPEQTVGLLLAAASTGDSHAETAVGFMTASGVGLTRDYMISRAWLNRASQQNNPYADMNLAMLYRDGLGGAPDVGRARELFKRAADRGVEQASTKLRELAGK